MIIIINNLIDGNLKLLSNSKDNSLNLKNFKDDLGNKLKEPKTFAKIMEKKELIAINPNEESCYKLTELGKKISENGGWIEHLKNQQKIEIETKKPTKKILITFLTIAFLSFILAFYYLSTNKK